MPVKMKMKMVMMSLANEDRHHPDKERVDNRAHCPDGGVSEDGHAL